MAVVQLTNHLADEIGEIVAVIHEWDQRGVLVTHGLPIDAVHVRRVEEIAHVPPGLVVDLVPLGVAIELHVEPGELQLVILGLELVLGEIDDGVILLDLDQHLLAVGGDLIGVDVTEDGLFPVFQAVDAEVPFAIAVVSIVVVPSWSSATVRRR